MSKTPSKRRFLALATVGIVTSGLALSLIPFLGYFSSNDTARSAALVVHLSDVPEGHFVAADRRELRVFIIHTLEDKVIVLGVPIKGNAVLMPDEKWWRPIRPCQDFGPSNVNGRLIEGGQFSCHDADLTDYQRGSWLWNSDGKYAGPINYPFDDMMPLRFERLGEEIVVKI